MAENTRLDIPIFMRWLGHLSNIKQRKARGEGVAASVTFAIRGEDAARRAMMEGIRILGRFYRVEEYLEAKCNTPMTWPAGWAVSDVAC